MLKYQQDGSVLKAAVKPMCGIREIKFYEQLHEENLNDPDVEAMRKFVPEYRGTVKMPFRGKIIDFIKLADLTHDMSEPCVIDIKIGKRTWDPFASTEKQLAEEQKYQACKKHLGFCIPGFQVYDIKSGRIKRYGKEYGKKLDQHSVKDGTTRKNKFFIARRKLKFVYLFLLFSTALKMFLNAETQLCRILLLKLLTTLWSIQTWARNQSSLRLYSSSLLLVYDAKRLKNQLFCNRSSSSNSSTPSPYDSLSRSSSVESPKQLTQTSPMHKAMCNGNVVKNHSATASSDPVNEMVQEPPPPHRNGYGNCDSSTDTSIESIQLYRQLQRCHSAQNNYEEVKTTFFSFLR